MTLPPTPSREENDRASTQRKAEKDFYNKYSWIAAGKSKIEVNPIFAAVAEYYGFTININSEFNYYVIEDTGKGRNSSNFYWRSTQKDDEFWDDLKKSFYDMGYDVAARW